MIEIGIDPVALDIGSTEVRWYGIMVSLAVLTGVMVPFILAKKEGIGEITRNQILNIAVWAVPGGLVGARLIHVIDDWSHYSAHPSEIIGGEGLGIFGAILGGTLVGVVYAKLKEIPIGRATDVAAFGLILAQVVGRIGCIINGCCHGEPTSLPWGVMYTHSDTAAETLARTEAVHPTHAYELFWDLMVFALIWVLRKRIRPAGGIFLIYISTYSLGRFLISFLRVNDAAFLGLQQAQIVSLIVFIVAIALLVRLFRKPTCDSDMPPLSEADNAA